MIDNFDEDSQNNKRERKVSNSKTNSKLSYPSIK
jgi:hypothetical protein